MITKSPRINKELITLQKYVNEKDSVISNINLDKLINIFGPYYVILKGPIDSPYLNGYFKLRISFPSNYPFTPPLIVFETKIYHPNININGSICVDILKTEWTSAYYIDKILLSISLLLQSPNPNDPLEPNIASVYKDDINEFNKTAMKWVIDYASSPVL